jgi:hypothetical protein
MSVRYAPEIYGPVPDTDDALRTHQRELVAYHNKMSGENHAPHAVDTRPEPRISDNRLLIDCTCGSCVGVTRRGTAFCMLCGAQYAGLVLPEVPA